MNKRRILLIIDHLNVGGAQRQMTFLARELSKKFDVHLFLFHSKTSFLEEELIECGIPITRIFKKSKYDFLFVWKFLKFVKSNKFDLSISFLETPNVYNELARMTRCVPYTIVGERSAYFKKDIIKLKIKLFEKLHFFADKIVTNSISQKSRMDTFFPRNANKRIYIPNGYEINSEDLNLRKTESNLKFIVLSNTNHYKNPLNLCKALVVYNQKFGTPEFKINWFGRINRLPNNIKIMENCSSILKENNLEKVLKFRGVTDKPYEEVVSSDILIHLSDYEGCPNGVCEAMLLKKPVILSNVCDHPYLVANDNGILTDQTSPYEISEALRLMVLKTNEELIEMGKRSHEVIKLKMSYTEVINKWESLINNIN